LPEMATFGWLIIGSFAFVCIGAVFYNVYACRNRERPKVGAAKYTDEIESSQTSVVPPPTATTTTTTTVPTTTPTTAPTD
jgi:hypothetical protein